MCIIPIFYPFKALKKKKKLELQLGGGGGGAFL